MEGVVFVILFLFFDYLINFKSIVVVLLHIRNQLIVQRLPLLVIQYFKRLELSHSVVVQGSHAKSLSYKDFPKKILEFTVQP